jgi:CheY-like chemotaxis protein
MAGGGTLCSVYLPCTAAALRAPAGDPPGGADVATAPAAHDAPPPEPAGAGAVAERVLVVEDEAPVRAVLRRLLERAGFSVLEARNGSDALAVWRERGVEIGLVLSDVVMPEVGGLALVEQLRAERADLPVLLISGYTKAALTDGVLPPGVEWLAKPFDGRAVVRIVGELLKRPPDALAREPAGARQ